MSRLQITMTVAVNEKANKADKNGTEEIYLRCAMQKAREVIDLVGRGKFDIEVTYDRLEKKGRNVKKNK
jgi:hypothetical protein